MKYKVVDNFLPDNEFQKVLDMIHDGNFGWHFNDGVALEQVEEHFYFTHTLYDQSAPRCHFYDKIFPFVGKAIEKNWDLNLRAVIRIKCNLYTRTEKIIEHDMHSDFDYNHPAFLLGINDCDGYTRFENQGKVESRANRMIYFDGYDKHCSTTCTDQKIRVNINFNFL